MNNLFLESSKNLDEIIHRKTLPSDLICEDYFTDFVINNEGLVITRKKINTNTYNFSKKSPLVCLNGCFKVISQFFTEIIDKMNNEITLLIIESDRVDLEKEWLDNPKLKHCYTWNKPFSHTKLSSLPIGLNYFRQYNTLNVWLLESFTHTMSTQIKLLAVNYSLKTNSIRSQLVEKANNEWNDFADVLQFIEPMETYWKESMIEKKIKIPVSNIKCYDVMKNYKFILSPPGAGEDTHRTWEALYIGTIPIVKKSNLNELYEDLPVLVIDDWNIITKELLENEFEKIQEKKRNNEYNMEKLYMNYWLRKVNPPKIHFMTYANHIFEKSKIRIIRESNDFGEFISTSGFGPEDIPHLVQTNFKDILNQKKGGGYWFWKPFIIYEKLKQIEDGEFLLYLDAGCHLNPLGKKRFYEYVNMLHTSKYGILSFQMTGNKTPGTFASEKEWTTKEIFDYFNVSLDSEMATSGQYCGGVFILKKNEHSIFFLKEMMNCFMKNPLLVTDYYNTTQAHYFKDNRHDQSISSLLRKKIGSVVIDGDESWMVPFGEGESLKYPFWAARSRE